MKRALVLIATSAIFTSLSLGFDATGDFKKFLMATKPKVEKAFANKDLSFFEKSSTDDFSESHGGQNMNKKDSMASLKQFFGMAKSISCKYDLVSASAKGNTGNAVMHSKMTAMIAPMAMKGKAKAKAQKWVMESWESQVWVKSGKTWKLKTLGDAKPMKMSVDGKSMDPAKVMGGGG
jgi:hypothetical protein